MTTDELEQRRAALLAERAECLAGMSDRVRKAFEQRQTGQLRHLSDERELVPQAGYSLEGGEGGRGALLVQVTELIAEAHRLRGMAERKRDIRTAMKGLDTALKALQLHGRLSGEISDSFTVNVALTRDEGIQTATELLLDLASAAELVLLIERFQQRVAELGPAPEPPAMEVASAEAFTAELAASNREENDNENG